jgi:hypothetical protein
MEAEIVSIKSSEVMEATEAEVVSIKSTKAEIVSIKSSEVMEATKAEVVSIKSSEVMHPTPVGSAAHRHGVASTHPHGVASEAATERHRAGRYARCANR